METAEQNKNPQKEEKDATKKITSAIEGKNRNVSSLEEWYRFRAVCN